MHDTDPTLSFAQQLSALRETITRDPSTLTDAIAERAKLEGRDPELGEGWMTLDLPSDYPPLLATRSEVPENLKGITEPHVVKVAPYNGPQSYGTLYQRTKAMESDGAYAALRQTDKNMTHDTAINRLNATNGRAMAREMFDRASEYGANGKYIACVNQDGYLSVAPNTPSVIATLEATGFRTAGNEGQRWFARVMPGENQEFITLNGERVFGPDAIKSAVKASARIAPDPAWHEAVKYWESHTPPADAPRAAGNLAVSDAVDAHGSAEALPPQELAESITTLGRALELLGVTDRELFVALRDQRRWAANGCQGTPPQSLTEAQLATIDAVFKPLAAAHQALKTDSRLNPQR